MIHAKIDSALQILAGLGFPRQQQNVRSACTLLALIDLRPGGNWKNASSPLVGITPVMDWVRQHYGIEYAPNSRETFRRQTMHQFRAAGLVLYNPDKPDRAVNSPAAAYRIAPEALALVRAFGTSKWSKRLIEYLSASPALAERYAKARDMTRVPVKISDEMTLHFSPGAHSELIRDVIVSFAPFFAPGSTLIYAGDTGEKLGFFDKDRLSALGVEINSHGKMPDVVFHCTERNWLLLVEAVSSHGPVDAKRHAELVELFSGSSAGLVYVTAFPTRAAMAKYVASIAWETEVWVAEAPTHLIHFNGTRFLGPYGLYTD